MESWVWALKGRDDIDWDLLLCWFIVPEEEGRKIVCLSISAGILALDELIRVHLVWGTVDQFFCSRQLCQGVIWFFEIIDEGASRPSVFASSRKPLLYFLLADRFDSRTFFPWASLSQRSKGLVALTLAARVLRREGIFLISNGLEESSSCLVLTEVGFFLFWRICRLVVVIDRPASEKEHARACRASQCWQHALGIFIESVCWASCGLFSITGPKRHESRSLDRVYLIPTLVNTHLRAFVLQTPTEPVLMHQIL